MSIREQKLLAFLNLDIDENTIDRSFEIEGRDIGEKIARFIIDKKAQLITESGRGFQSVDDILAVKYVGPERLELMLAAAQKGMLDAELDRQKRDPEIVNQCAFASAEVAVGFAKQADNIVDGIRQALRIAENEAFESKRKALELIESAGLSSVQSAPLFIGRFLSQTKDQQSIYPLDQINIVSANRISDDEVILDYIVMAETQFFCSGVDLEKRGTDRVVRFSRDHISSKGKASSVAIQLIQRNKR
jgi:hypothetical protein